MKALHAVAITAAALLSFGVVAVQSESSFAVDDGTLGISPAEGGDFFHLNARPGESVDATAIVTNHSGTAMTLLTYAVDALATSDGSFALTGQSDDQVGVGLWASTPLPQVIVPAESQLRVPMTITVPVGVVPGDYEGGLIIQNLAVTGINSDSGGTPVRIDVVQRQGARIYLTVPGTATKVLVIKDLAWTTTDSETNFTLRIKNTGNTTLHPTAVLDVSRWFSSDAELTFSALESVPPGATVALTAKLPSAPLVQIGSAHAVVTSAATTVSAETSILQIPWPLLVGLVVVIAALAFTVALIIRFSRRVKSAFAQIAALDAGP